MFPSTVPVHIHKVRTGTYAAWTRIEYRSAPRGSRPDELLYVEYIATNGQRLLPAHRPSRTPTTLWIRAALRWLTRAL